MPVLTIVQIKDRLSLDWPKELKMSVYVRVNMKIYTGTPKVKSVSVWERVVQDAEMVY
jgi:hypothetical protein